MLLICSENDAATSEFAKRHDKYINQRISMMLVAWYRGPRSRSSGRSLLPFANMLCRFLFFIAIRNCILAVPMAGLDLPREMAMDINKGRAFVPQKQHCVSVWFKFARPYPVINIIGDEASLALGQFQGLDEDRRAERLRARTAQAERKSREKDVELDVEKQYQQLARLSDLRKATSRIHLRAK